MNQLDAFSMASSALLAIPEMFRMQDVNDDPDLKNRASQLLQAIALSPQTFEMTQKIAQSLLHVLARSKNWHIRGRVPNVLLTLIFNQLFTLDTQQNTMIIDAIMTAMCDAQVEVSIEMKRHYEVAKLLNYYPFRCAFQLLERFLL
jgi:hypothetical protein